MTMIPGAICLSKTDFTSHISQGRILSALNDRKADLRLNDMSPNGMAAASGSSFSSLPHLSVSISTLPPSSPTSPLSMKIKNEPISSQREQQPTATNGGGVGQQQNNQTTTTQLSIVAHQLATLQRPTSGHLSGHPLTPSTSSWLDPSDSSDYEGPIGKCIRVTADGWPACCCFFSSSSSSVIDKINFQSSFIIDDHNIIIKIKIKSIKHIDTDT
ncbi:Myocyte-specific enhancer factor 2C [Dermatophagoides farinae]|uniref:Myocyte-specific enhancer factor 2C n=1 Tax=Dermatophagoides farinae TaxID=6954 RepID=A0A922HX40_DERFA|nr:Myocyte-specific enhancer factor 2C [Dermatophagoides farinae]